ncbi:hypothetical protein B7463_g6571, partial [Scytalidium lignicola]
MAPQAPSAALADQLTPREVPCSWCLYSLARWKAGPPQVCADDKTASSKCSYCSHNNKTCISPVGLLKARSRALAASIVACNGVPDVRSGKSSPSSNVQESAVRKRSQEHASCPSAELRQEEIAEQKERSILALESMGRSLDQLSKNLEGFREDYHRLHPELDAPSDEEEVGIF